MNLIKVGYTTESKHVVWGHTTFLGNYDVKQYY